MKTFDVLDIGERILDISTKQRIEEAEVFIEDVVTTHIRATDNSIESVRTIHSQGIGLCAIAENRKSYSFISGDLSSCAMNLVEKARCGLQLSLPDPYNGLPDAQVTEKVPGCSQQSMSEVATERKVALALETERIIRGADAAIVSTENVEYIDFDRTTTILSSKGIRNQACQSLATLAATAIASDRNGECQSGTAYSHARVFTHLSASTLAHNAVARAKRVTGAVPISSRALPVVLDPLVAGRFVDILAHSIQADSVRKGRSLLKSRLGEQIASRLVTLIDDGRNSAFPFASPFDAEGTPTRKTVVVRNGTLETFLYDAYEARAVGMRSTGNAYRASFRDFVQPSKNCLYIQAGEQSPETIITSLKRGFYVQEVQGIHTANPISGDFSVGVTGGWIEDGAWKHAVRGVTIAGNLFDLLNNVEEVGNDLQFSVSPRVMVACTRPVCAGSPTLQIAELTISGN